MAPTAGSDVVVITAGIARKPGMSRDDLLSTNAKIVGSVAENVKATSPNAVVIVVSNPLDAMVQRALQVTGFPPQRVMRPGRRARYGPLSHVSGDGAGRERRRCFGAARWAATATRWCRCQAAPASAAFPLRRLLSEEKLNAIVDRARNGGAEIVSLLKTGSAYYAPAAATAQMVEAIVRDKKRLIPVRGVLRQRVRRRRILCRRAGHSRRGGRRKDHRAEARSAMSRPHSTTA